MSRILVVDDSDLVRKMIIALLTDHGYEVAPAASAEEAYQAVQKNLPDLIVMDVMLPDVKGDELCRYFRGQAATRHTPIIMVTGAARESEEKVRGFQSGADDYILKPFDPQELLERVRAVLRRAALRAAEPGPVKVVPAKVPPAVPGSPSYPGVMLAFLAGMNTLLFAGTLLAPGSSLRPLLVCLSATAIWGLLVTTLVVACSFLSIQLLWKEGGRLLSMASLPLLVKWAGACVFSGWTTLSPFFFTAGPALFINSPAFLTYRLDLFELGALALLGLLLRKRPGATPVKAIALALAVWGLAVVLLAGLQQLGGSQ